MKGNLELFFSFQVELVYTDNQGKVQTFKVFEFKTPGVALAMYNTTESIESFAHSSFQVSFIT